MINLIAVEQIASSIDTSTKDRSPLNVGTPDPSRTNIFISDFLGHQLKMNRHDPRQSNPIGTECSGQDGGKIVEKANASSNVLDTKYDPNPWINPWTLKCGLNSTLLLMTYTQKGMCTKVCYTRDRYYSTYRKDIADLP